MEIQINGKKIEFRKWKVKDKKELDHATTKIEKRKIIVYNCLKDYIPLDLDEYNYVLAQIRDFSLHTDIDYTLQCDCGETFNVSLPIKDIVTFKNADYSPIIVDDVTIELKNIDDKDYEVKINETLTTIERYILDFIFHIKSINGNELEIDKLLDYFDNLNIDTFEKIIDCWDARRSKCLYNKQIECPKCHKFVEYNLADMEGFFPKSWNL